MRFFWIFSVLAFFLISCSSEDKSSGELYEDVLNKNYDGESQDELYVLVTPQGSANDSGGSNQVNGTANCPNCPPSLGYLITKEFLAGQSFMDSIVLSDLCQGYLFGDDVFLVSFYCLPQTLQSVGKSCEDEVQVVVPQFDDREFMKVFDCDQLMDLRSTDIDLSNDDFQLNWAVLKLKERGLVQQSRH